MSGLSRQVSLCMLCGNTVEPFLKDCPIDRVNVASQDRSQVTGSVTLSVGRPA